MVQSGATQREAARAVNVRESTVSGWMHDPEVKAHLEESRLSVVQVVQQTIERRAEELADALVNIGLEGENEGARVAAIKHALALLGVEGGEEGGARVVIVSPGALDDETRAKLKAQARRQKAAGGMDE